MNRDLNWERYWQKCDHSISLDSDGFCFSYDSAYFYDKYTDVFSLNSGHKAGCLILLGEAGSGKSSVFSQYEHLNKDKSRENLFINLNRYSSEDRLINEVFGEIGKRLKDGRLYVYLDSFDECLNYIPTLIYIFDDKISSLGNNKDDLYLRISCRSGSWPEDLTEIFKKVWGRDNVQKYKILPLTRDNILEAARSLDVDEKSFIETIIDKGLQPLAIRPLTLRFLIDIFKQDNKLPMSQVELFEKGCLELCREDHKRHKQSKDSLTAEKRLALASRIAAVMVFCNYSTVKLNNSGIDKELYLSMVGEGEELIGSQNKFTFMERDLREVLENTALFIGMESDRLTFSHWSYAEYLAARYLIEHKLSDTQIYTLTELPNEVDRKIVVQLKGVYRWLILLRPELIFRIIRNNPIEALCGEIPVDLRKELVESIFNQIKERNILAFDSDLLSNYFKLDHNELTDQLRPYIEDKDMDIDLRYTSIKIAGQSKRSEIQGILVDISLDISDDLYIRTIALEEVVQFADDLNLIRLKPLALEIQDSDLDDNLKGISLKTLSEKALITKEEVFNTLFPPKDNSVSTFYNLFLNTVINQITRDDLLLALNVVDKNLVPKMRYEYSGFYKLINKILFLAWTNLDITGVIDKLTDIIINDMIKEYPDGHIFQYENWHFPSPDKKFKREMIKILIKKIRKIKGDSLSIFFSEPLVIKCEDMEWLIEELEMEESLEIKPIWARIIRENYNQDFSGHFEMVYAVKEKYLVSFPFLNDLFYYIFGEASDFMKKLHFDKINRERRREQEQERNSKAKKSLDEETIHKWLTLINSGNLDYWWFLCDNFAYRDDSDKIELFHPDIEDYSRWKLCEDITKEMIIEAAKKYILNRKISKTIFNDRYLSPDLAGYKAFRLILKNDKAFISTLPVKIWENWSPIFIWYPLSSDKQDTDFQYLVNTAFINAPQKMYKTVSVKLNCEMRKTDGHIGFFLEEIRFLYNKRIEGLLISYINNTINENHLLDIFSFLMSQGSVLGEDYARSILVPIKDKDCARAAALSLMSDAKDAGWDIIWPIIQDDVEFGRTIFLSERMSYFSQKSKLFFKRIGPTRASELFIWLNRNFPPEDEILPKDSFMITPRLNIPFYKQELIDYFEADGSDETVRAIENIKRECPSASGIDRALVRARVNLRYRHWTPSSPEEFLFLAKNAANRIINDADDLQNIVLESLERYEKKLQGETSLAFTLWDITSDAIPKDENNLSDTIKSHLQNDLNSRGILSCREVEIRRKIIKDGAQGEEPDIVVSYFINSLKIWVAVAIEVKGDWHSEVNTAMETQLRDRYLTNSNFKHGIYIVGWYNCKVTPKKNNTKCNDIEEARGKYRKLANDKSVPDKIIKSYVLNCALDKVQPQS